MGIMLGLGVVIFIVGVGGGSSDNGRNKFVICREPALTGGGVGEGVGGSSR